jgi:hypothetical protein
MMDSLPKNHKESREFFQPRRNQCSGGQALPDTKARTDIELRAKNRLK